MGPLIREQARSIRRFRVVCLIRGPMRFIQALEILLSTPAPDLSRNPCPRLLHRRSLHLLPYHLLKHHGAEESNENFVTRNRFFYRTLFSFCFFLARR